MKKTLQYAELALIVALSLAPVFASFPYRINIFLSWEGAYRLSEGEIPYRDFGMPVGYMYWVIPALFFKVLGAQLITLVKAQAFINILAGLAFRSILKSLDIEAGIRFMGVALFCLSYSFLNYWPWYNHTVIVYELIALAFLFRYIRSVASPIRKYSWLAGAGAFVFFSFFTKQDGGGLALLLCIALLSYESWEQKNWKPIPVFLMGFIVTGALIIIPLLPYGFQYWFNHGQPPHTSRISISDILSEFFNGSQWIKFYLFIIVLLLIARAKQEKGFFKNRTLMLFSLLTLGILAEAAIFQVTSYVPVDNNIFFHSFAIVFILYLLAPLIKLDFNHTYTLLVAIAGLFLWWSQMYWKYMERFLVKPDTAQYSSTTHAGYEYADVINKNTFIIGLDSTDVPMHLWRTSSLKGFEKMLLPGPTVDGMERLKALPELKEPEKAKVLNMTELTPLAYSLGFPLEKGSYYPLWFHKGVASFQKETDLFVQRIQNNYYNVVLYEYIPYLNNFYPFAVREALQKNYIQVDRFTAPRKPSTQAWIEVFVKRKQE